MEHAYGRAWDFQGDFGFLAAADAAWGAPPPVADAEADADDWSGVLGACHAHRRPEAPAPSADGAVLADWGQGVHAM